MGREFSELLLEIQSFANKNNILLGIPSQVLKKKKTVLNSFENFYLTTTSSFESAANVSDANCSVEEFWLNNGYYVRLTGSCKKSLIAKMTVAKSCLLAKNVNCDITDMIELISPTVYSNLYKYLQLAITIPISSATCERSFSATRKLSLCLICEKTFSNEAMKPSRMKDHLSKIHSDKLEKPLSFFQALKAKIEKQSTVNSLFKKQTSDLDKGLVASYKVSLLIAKNSKPHSIGETLILPALKEIIDTMQGEGTSNKMIKSIPLSNDTVSKRIDEMADDIENKLINYLREKILHYRLTNQL
ncbi:hypothetical protein QTP88_007043 [Uroleucon formosanum]